METLGERIKYLRDQKGLSQDELAKEVGLSKNTVYNYENGKRLPDANALIQLCKYFCVSADFLLGINAEAVPGLEEYMNTITQYGDDCAPFNAAMIRMLEAGVAIEKKDIIVKAILGLSNIFNNLETALTTTFKEAKEIVNRDGISLIQEISLDDLDDETRFSTWKPSNSEYLLAFISSRIDEASNSYSALSRLLDDMIRDYKYKTALKQLRTRKAKLERSTKTEESQNS